MERRVIDEEQYDRKKDRRQKQQRAMSDQGDYCGHYGEQTAGGTDQEIAVAAPGDDAVGNPSSTKGPGGARHQTNNSEHNRGGRLAHVFVTCQHQSRPGSKRAEHERERRIARGG